MSLSLSLYIYIYIYIYICSYDHTPPEKKPRGRTSLQSRSVFMRFSASDCVVVVALATDIPQLRRSVT